MLSDIVERLRRKTRRHVLASMPEEAKHLEQESLVDLLIEYRTWRGQFIAPVPRRIHLAEELRASDLSEGQEKVLGRIVAKIEAGEDLTSHLSSAVQRVPRLSRNGVARRDHLLSEWGMHHLHLSEKMMGDGFFDRSADALFVIFHPEDAYLIGIYGHPKEENWAAREIFARVPRNWPDAGLALEAKGIIGLSQQYSDEDYEELRKAGLAGPVEVDGKVWTPAGIGQTLAGTPLEATREAQELMWAFKGWEEEPHRRLAEVEGVEREAYWVPAVSTPLPGFEEYAGFFARGVFVRAGRIC